MRQQAGGEHVQLALARPADDVAARGGRGQPARDRQPRLRRVELREARVQHDRELAGARVETLLQAHAGMLELGEDALDVVDVAIVMPSHEGLGRAFHPRHGSTG